MGSTFELLKEWFFRGLLNLWPSVYNLGLLFLFNILNMNTTRIKEKNNEGRIRVVKNKSIFFYKRFSSMLFQKKTIQTKNEILKMSFGYRAPTSKFL